VAVAAGHGQHLGGDVLGQAVGQASASACSTLATPAICGGLRGGAGVVAGHQHVDVAAAGLAR
jgi:hypothetical protein